MHRLLIACLFLVVVTGCSPKSESAPAGVIAREGTTAAEVVRPPGAAAPRRTLAYEHTLQIEIAEEKLAATHQAALAACREASADLCEVLDSRINTGKYASSSLRLRAKPSGIQKLIASMGKQGEITGQSTSTEDLAGPIQDVEKKQAMLTTYRSELEALRKRPGNDADALIKLTRELAQVQSELEAADGRQANLLRRVETEILTINIQAGRDKSFWRPISLAASDFGGSLSQGISSAITGVAYLLPWSVVLGLLFWIGRKLWRRRKPR
ncbi:DUF4349 domain-containing protein [Mitsuaria sp. 7]|uniref:DUF4349 domain-containing protein n=1 Tax=Mitsuaria sp. 7 TaxID=1658665 RepID=UPI0009EF10C0|nr:DUF4349 domain-containing protein [Mitsuaria sp. 7]